MKREEFLESKGVFARAKELIGLSKHVKIAVAYLTKGGFEEVSENLERFLKSDKENKFDIVVGLSSYCITEPSALDSLAKLKRSFPRQVTVKYYYHEGFHPKMFIFEHEKETNVLVGSSNLTWQGMNFNVEANVTLARPKNSPLVRTAEAYFEKLMHYARDDIESASKRYSRIYGRVTRKRKQTGTSSTGYGMPKTSLPPQYFVSIEAIERLAAKCKILWKISPGTKGYEWNRWVKPDGSGRMAIGWDDKNEIGALTQYKSRDELQQYIDDNRKKWGGAWTEKGENGGTKDPSWYVAQQLWRFYKETHKDNVVIA
jgi:HKD family nuclease